MIIDYTCFLCRLSHPVFPTVCPHAGRSPESLARLHAKRVVAEQQRHYADLEATNQRNLAASKALKAKRQRQEIAQRLEWDLAIAKTQLAVLRQAEQAKRQADSEATMDELHDVLRGVHYVEARDERALVRRLIDKCERPR